MSGTACELRPAIRARYLDLPSSARYTHFLAALGAFVILMVLVGQVAFDEFVLRTDRTRQRIEFLVLFFPFIPFPG